MKNNKRGEMTGLWVSKRLSEALKNLGRKGDTYEDIIWNLIKEAGYDEVIKVNK